MVTEFIATYPKLSIIGFALLISFIISLVNYFMLDKEKMRVIKERQKFLQEEMKKNQGNPDKLMEINKEFMSHTGDMMKHSFKPMIITFLPIILLFNYMRGAFAETTLAGSWFWWYLVASIVGSIIFRKVFKLP